MPENEQIKAALLAWLESQNAPPGPATNALLEVVGDVMGLAAHNLADLVEGVSLAQTAILANAMRAYLNKPKAPKA